jgi:hypothetical protein
MKPIREFLAALGVAVRPGSAYMFCPKCKAEKLTASDTKNVATCWACNAHFVPGKEREEEFLTWHHRVMDNIADLCREELATRTYTMRWLTEKRHLPSDINWLTGNGLGALPSELPVNKLRQLAEDTLESDMARARAATDDLKKLDRLKEIEETQKEYIEEFFEIKIPAIYRADSIIGAVTYIYTNRKGNCVSINLRPFYLEEHGQPKTLRRIQPPGSDRGLFNPKVSQGTHWEDIGLSPVIVEGEHNWLSLLARNQEWRGNDRPCEWSLTGCAMGGKNGADGKELAATFPDDVPFIIYDNDTIADDGLPGGFDLVRGINNWTPVYAVATQRAKDIDDLVWSSGMNYPRLTEASFLKMWNDSVYIPRPYKVVGEELNKILGTRPNRLSIQAATDVLRDDLRMRGESLRVKTGADDGFGLMVIQDKDENLRDMNRIVQVVKDHPSWKSLMRQYGIGASDPAGDKLGEEVACSIRDGNCPTAELHVLSHYDPKTKCLYVDELNRVLKLSPDGKVEILQNGDEGVIFTPAGDARQADFKLGIGKLRIRGGQFEQQILNSIRWDESNGFLATSAKHLYKWHVLSIFFDTLMKGKACPLFEGKAGGGKNTISMLTGMVFEGAKFNISPMPLDGKSLDEMTVDKIYVAFDEYDCTDAKMEGAFRSWCTRSWAERRQLYETWTTTVRPLARGMAVSTNSNPVRDVATSQRQLMFSVLPRQDNMDDEKYMSLGGALYPEFLKHRNTIWSELISDLRAMVTYLGKADLTKVRTSFRMSDFAVPFIVGATAEGWGDEARAMLRQMKDMQMEDLAEKHTVVMIMNQYLVEHPEEQGVFKTQGVWQEELRKMVNPQDRQTADKLTASHLRTMFSGKSSDIMVGAFSMKVSDMNNKERQHKYAFWLKNRAPGEAGGVLADSCPPAYDGTEMVM